MAHMADSKRKFDPPEGASAEFMLTELWSDMKEVKECVMIGNGKPSLKAQMENVWLALKWMSVVIGIYLLTHIADVVQSLGKWIGII